MTYWDAIEKDGKVNHNDWIDNRVKQLTEQKTIPKESCSCCGSDKFTMPKAGSGTVTHWVCLQCVTDRNLDVLPEYLENIKEFGHWHRPLNGGLK